MERGYSIKEMHSFDTLTLKRKLINVTYTYSNGEGNGTPLQYSCLENPMDGGAW